MLPSLAALKIHGGFVAIDTPLLPAGSTSELYEMAEGTSEADIADYIRKKTEERYEQWIKARDAAEAVRAAVVETRGMLSTGPLMQDTLWTEAVTEFRSKYIAHRQASSTRLPMSLRIFEDASGKRRPQGLTPERYRQLLVSADPVQGLADQFGMPRAEVEALLKPPRTSYLEFTFLARVISRFAKRTREGAGGCVELTLQLINTLVDGTYLKEFPKTKIQGNEYSSRSLSMFSMDSEELAAMVRYVQAQVQQSGTDQEAVRKILKAFELIWHFPIPEADREDWLQVDPRQSIVRLLT
jgi:hypothetical protein